MTSLRDLPFPSGTHVRAKHPAYPYGSDVGVVISNFPTIRVSFPLLNPIEFQPDELQPA